MQSISLSKAPVSVRKRTRLDLPRIQREHPPTSLLDTPMRLSLPYNHAADYPEWLDAHAEGVCEVYLPLHGALVASLRPWVGPETPEAYAAELRRLAQVCDRHGISANVVLNAPVPDRMHAQALRGIGEALEIFTRMTVTLADYHFAKAVRRAFPDVEIGVSTGVHVDTPQGALFWIEGVGAGNIALSRGINKRLDAITAIRALGIKLKMVLQDDCIPNCPAELSHYGQTEFCGVTSTGGKCYMDDVRNRDPWLVALKDVVPAEMPFYEGLIDVGKIAGRTKPLAVIARDRELYLAMESWVHPVGYFRDSLEAFQRIVSCDRNCHTCGWCERNLQRVPMRQPS